MTSEETLPYGKSPGRASRVVCETLNSEQKPSHGHRSSKKSQNEKPVWFTPVSSPLLSPGREKTRQIVRKTARQASIFSMHSRAKGAIEAEEPTSPKVSCIGQVRANKKNKEAAAEDGWRKAQQSKPGSASPARFFTSPGRQAKWGSLFGSRKEGNASPSPSGYGGGELSCFSLPCDSPSALGSNRRCGAFLAKSLILLQECGDMAESSDGVALQIYPHAVDNQQEQWNPCAAGVDAKPDAIGCANPHAISHAHPHAHSHGNSHAHDNTQTSLGVNYTVFQKKGAYHHEKPCDGKKPITHAKPYDGDKHADDIPYAHIIPSKEHHHVKPRGLKHQPTYEELPSLYCGVSNKKNLKISLEVVPETWLWRNGEKLRTDGFPHLNCVPESSRDSNRDELQKAREKEPSSKHQFPPDQSQATYPKASNVEEKSIDSIPVDDTTCKYIEADNEEKNSIQHICMDESTCSHHIPESPCTHMGAFNEEKKDSRIFDSQDGAGDRNWQAHDLRHREEDGHELDIIDVEKQRFLLGSSEFKKGRPIPIKSGCDMEKQNYGLLLPQPVKKNLHFMDPHEDAKGVWGICKDKKSEPLPAQSFSALILVGYNLKEQPLSLKDAGDKLTNSEELLKGRLEVERLSFHGTGRYLQWLKGDAEFIRSRSATSHRTVIQLQRCNSEPCRSSC